MMLLKPQWKDMQSKRFLSGGLKMAANVWRMCRAGLRAMLYPTTQSINGDKMFKISINPEWHIRCVMRF
jgi:hypothetical protein